MHFYNYHVHDGESNENGIGNRKDASCQISTIRKVKIKVKLYFCLWSIRDENVCKDIIIAKIHQWSMIYFLQMRERERE